MAKRDVVAAVVGIFLGIIPSLSFKLNFYIFQFVINAMGTGTGASILATWFAGWLYLILIGMIVAVVSESKRYYLLFIVTSAIPILTPIFSTAPHHSSVFDPPGSFIFLIIIIEIISTSIWGIIGYAIGRQISSKTTSTL